MALALVLAWPALGIANPPPTAYDGHVAEAGAKPADDGWKKAEALVIKYLGKRHKKVEVAEKLERWPYVFWMYVDDSEHRYEVVVGTKRFTKRGNRGLRAYLKATKALGPDGKSPLPKVGQLTELLGALAAYPPVSKKLGLEPDAFVSSSQEPAALRPVLNRTDKGAWKLTLNYLVEAALLRGGSRRGPKVRRVERWHLTIQPNYKLRWTKEEATYP